ncbi:MULTISPECIES: hypothetical protein [Ramlibacter]|jgi:hypothetical protein|uniref:Uncharacterized protein n=1 Tax=Ramlibacter pinisoli TaxID=2682844 RepID=A0A6N8IZX5_9BURK|nr:MULTISPECIES: hypothetical protein [Ramlibacter]MBA2962396.1 hypothetical protein [Ramlibacter sp. CGMCC 1.13660]MVQ32338.1 hypothetical protein [Ramlibacter pinisoli]
MTLIELQHIKQWHVGHRASHPVEYHLWDTMLMLWLAGWIGWLPAFAFDELWTVPLCVFAISAPDVYTAWRARAHRRQRLRCDWLCAAPRSLPRGPDVRG